MSNERLAKIEEHTLQLLQESIRQRSLLEEHQRRSLALEEDVKKLWERHAPLERHAAMWAGAAKFVSLLAVVGGLVLAVAKVFLG